MTTITLRDLTGGIGSTTKGSPLTNAEVDANFNNLNNDKLEVTGTAAKATNLDGGSTGSVPYQSDTGETSFLAAGTENYVLSSNGPGQAPSWKTAGGATGGNLDRVFFLNEQVVSEDYTIPLNMNAGTFGPVEVNDGITVTISDGSVWTIA